MASNASNERRPRPQLSSDHFNTSLYVGLGTGTIGAAYAAGSATLRGRPVVLWSGYAGLQWLVLGSTFWFTRGLATTFTSSGQQHDVLSLRQELTSSSLAGSVAGMAGGALRGYRNIVPGAVVCGLIGLTGQLGISLLAARDAGSRDNRPLLDRLSDSKWWPLKSIPDTEYNKQLMDKINGIDVEISMIDEQILALKQQRQLIPRKD